ncbi:MAG: adenosine deaminase [Firmicutes bacterium]|nr:adenosine deaminase [Bacillota bacterium]
MKDKFIKALEANDLLELQKVNKSDLHNHGTRGGNIKYIEKCYGRSISRLKFKFKNLNEMQKWYTKNIKSVCIGTMGYEKRIEAAFTQARNDGVKVLSMSFGYDESIFYNYSIEKWINVLKTIHKKIAPNVFFIPELGFERGIKGHRAMEILDMVSEYEYFKSIDLYGNEFSLPIGDYKKLYKKAKDKGMILKAHVGEFGEAESIKEAVEELELDQVQHGISAINSKKVMKYLADNEIQLNICPTSNVFLSIVKDYKSHPIRKLYDNGIKVTINTDDMIIFNKSVSEEFLNLYNEKIFNGEELNNIRENGLNI